MNINYLMTEAQQDYVSMMILMDQDILTRRFADVKYALDHGQLWSYNDVLNINKMKTNKKKLYYL